MLRRYLVADEEDVLLLMHRMSCCSCRGGILLLMLRRYLVADAEAVSCC